MTRLLRPLTLYVLTTSLYLIAVSSSGLASTAAAVAGHALAVAAVLLAIYQRRHPDRQVAPGPPFTRTRVWRAFKLFYCVAVPPLVYVAVTAYQDAHNPYMNIDYTSDVAAQMKEAYDTLIADAPVVQSMWLGLPLVAVGVFYAIRGCVAYIIGRPEEGSVRSRAA